MYCDNLTHIDNGEVYLPNGTGHGSIAMYYCDTGYYLVGNDTRECGLDKQWSIYSPTCQSTAFLTLLFPKHLLKYLCVSSEIIINIR